MFSSYVLYTHLLVLLIILLIFDSHLALNTKMRCQQVFSKLQVNSHRVISWLLQYYGIVISNQ